MTALRPPELGPIVGHTTEDSCRLWIAGTTPGDSGAQLSSSRRTVGVIGLIGGDGKDRPEVKPAYYFRLQREFDRTGTFVLGRDVALGRHALDGVPPAQRGRPHPLAPDTEYTVRMGTLALDDPMPDAESLSDRDLEARLPPIENMAPLLLDLPAETCEATFRTFPRGDQLQQAISFLLGSCRYPGLLWKVKEADRIFGPMKDRFFGLDERGRQTDDPARFILMVGDQIYADLFNRLVPLGRADTYEEFQDRYREALGSPNMRRLLRRTPVYMILDDHEIEDNWTQDRLHDSGLHRLFNFAIGAYMSYQWSHGPRTFGRMLYYHFDCAGYPFFVLDARTQRYKDDQEGLADNHLLGRPTIDPDHPGQLWRLLDWLSEQQDKRRNAPKFIASPSVFAPNPMDERIPWDRAGAPRNDDDVLYAINKERREHSDSWPAFPRTRRAILDHILENGIQNVVFLTGDIHCSNIARMRLEKDGADAGLTLYDVTSSAFYWPFPFADGDPNNYVHDSAHPEQRDAFPLAGGNELHYRAWAFTQIDNFCRIDVDRERHCLRVRYFDNKGREIKVSDESGRRKVAANTLPLAPW